MYVHYNRVAHCRLQPKSWFRLSHVSSFHVAGNDNECMACTDVTPAAILVALLPNAYLLQHAFCTTEFVFSPQEQVGMTTSMVRWLQVQTMNSSGNTHRALCTHSLNKLDCSSVLGGATHMPRSTASGYGVTSEAWVGAERLDRHWNCWLGNGRMPRRQSASWALP